MGFSGFGVTGGHYEPFLIDIPPPFTIVNENERPSGVVFADVGLSVEDDVYLLLSQLLLPIFEYGVFKCCGR